jgi:hypothetical protein
LRVSAACVLEILGHHPKGLLPVSQQSIFQ